MSMLSGAISKKTLSVKLISLFMLVAVLSAFVTSAVLSAYEIKTAEEAESRRLSSIAEILAPNLTASILFEDYDTANELIQPLRSQPSIVTVAVYDIKGQLFVTTVVEDKLTRVNQHDLNRISVPLEIDGIHYGKLVIGADNSEVSEHIKFYAGFLLGMLAVILLISFIASIFLSNRFIQPIISLADLANQITNSSDYTLRASVASQDELGDLSRCINSMLDTIEQRDQTLELQVQQRTTELKVANKKLQTQAYKDSLSGLPNRRHLLELIEFMVGSKTQDPEPFALFFLDLDGFKDVNDTLGHDSGDLLIVAAAERLKESIGQEHVIARLGGDEFTVLVRNKPDISQLESIAELIRIVLKRPFKIHGEKVYISASIGISCFPESASSGEGILKNADMAMYEAKGAGRDCYRFFEPSMQERVEHKRRLLDDLHLAIERDELELYFQPIVNLQNGRIEKAEALVRWNHPQQGLVSPDDFIAVAEESGQIVEIGAWVAEKAIHCVEKFRREYCDDFSISINVSPVQFKPGCDWLEQFLLRFDEANLGEDALSIEITENMLMASDSASLSKLMSLKDKGIKVAIDDFGVGYSSLSYLQKLEIDTIKIDRSFVSQLHNNFASATLCKTIINMAKNLGVQVVAEGIESDFQLEHLVQFGCHYGQGYYFARPQSQQDFEALLSLPRQAECAVAN